MAIKVGQAFERTSANPIDVTLALTKAQMVAVNDNLMPTYYFTICQDDGKVYLYDKSATASVTTGKFKEFSGGSGSGGSAVFETTATLKTDINDSDVILAADLPGVAFSDIIVGATLIRDSKGTIGLVTAKSGTASVVVTTATTSTPTKELTKAQYDALPQADKDNGTIYFVTDTSSSILPASSKTYTTTEQVVGTWVDGKPLYQKTIDIGALPDTSIKQVDTGLGNNVIDNIIYINGFSKKTSDGNYFRPLPYVYGGTANDVTGLNTIQRLTEGIWIQKGTSNYEINIITGYDRTVESGYVTLRYTKKS